MKFGDSVWMATVAVLVVTIVPVASSQGTYKQIDFPGAKTTYCHGINAEGDVVGYYQHGQNPVRGFFLRRGVFTSISLSDSVFSLASGINNVGQIVGNSVRTGSSYGTPFVYDMQSRSYVPFEYSGSTITSVAGINDAGTIVGSISTLNGRPSVGFKLNGATYTTVHVPNSTGSALLGINNLDEALLEGGKTDFNTYFLLTDSGVTPLLQSDSEFMTGLNDFDTLVGFYSNDGSEFFGFVQAKNGQRVPIKFPNARATLAMGVNNDGVVVGSFYSTTGPHCFTWTPDRVK